MQERLLSRRVLHFTQRQIFWECRERQTCETFPHGVPVQLQQSHLAIYKGIDPDVEGARLREQRGRLSHPELNIYELWNSIVEAYTRGSLTSEDDKFVAIMGLAQHIQKLLSNKKNSAGLWEDYLADQLLWYPARKKGMIKPQSYIAPSWSWASMIVPIIGPCLIRDPSYDGTLIQIVDLNVQTLNNQPLGQVTSGYLHLRGSLVRGRIWEETTPGWELGPETSIIYDVYDNGKVEPVDYVPSLDVSECRGSTYALPVKSISYETNGNLRARGLLLQLTGQCVREFRRVGTFQVRDLSEVVENQATHYIPLVGDDPLSADDILLDGFVLDGKTLDTLTIV